VKTCPQCAGPNEDGAAFCATCGGIFSATPAVAPAVVQETSGKALASMCFGFLFLVFPAAIVAVILGHMSNSEIRKSGGRLKGGGMALAGMLLGYTGIALFPVVLVVIAVVTIPNLMRTNVSTNEVGAVADLRRVSSAASAYFQKYKAYPPSLEALGPPPAGQAASATAAGLLDASLSSGIRGGYVISYSPLSSHRHEEIDGFNADADPTYQGATGQRHFHVDETGVIREQMSNAAGRNSPVLH
jgi:competence protein ComGC